MACFPSSTVVTHTKKNERERKFPKEESSQKKVTPDKQTAELEPEAGRHGGLVQTRDGAPPPGIFRLFAIGELVGYKPCAILAASWWVSGDGQCRDETQ